MRWSLAIALCLVSSLGARTASAKDIDADPASYMNLLATLAAGDTLHLAAGNYPLLPISNLNGTPNAWVVITGPASGAPAVVDANACCNTVEIINSSYLAIENLTVDGHNIDGAFGVSAKGDLANMVHDIRIEGCTFVNHLGSQQHDAISTKTPTWGWTIRHNHVNGAGTGLYLGNSDGSDPFIGGLVEDNLVENPIGYCMEIKFQQPRPSVPGAPTLPTTTIIRNNVFIKNDAPSPDGDRPNILVGGFPATGAGSSDRYEIYGNLFFHNPRESLLQASGRVTIHDNIFVDAPATRAMLLQDQDLPLELAYVYNNTIYATASGIVFGNAAPQGDAVAGNLVFSPTPISGPITDQRDNLIDTVANAPAHVDAPSIVLGQMSFYPLAGQCTGSSIDESKFAMDTDYASDFNGNPKGQFQYRGAYAGAGTNPGWPLGDGIKGGGASGDAGTPSGTDSGGPSSEDGAAAMDAGAARDGEAGMSNGAAPSGTPGGCSCREAARGTRHGAATGLLAMLALLAARARRRARERRRHRARMPGPDHGTGGQSPSLSGFRQMCRPGMLPGQQSRPGLHASALVGEQVSPTPPRHSGGAMQSQVRGTHRYSQAVPPGSPNSHAFKPGGQMGWPPLGSVLAEGDETASELCPGA